MGYKPDIVQKAKFECSPLGQVFNKGLDTSTKQVGLLKRLKNIEDKTDRQLQENKENQLGIKSIGYTIKEELSQEAKNILEKFNNQEKLINYKKCNFKRGNTVDYDFSEYRSLKELFKAIYYRNIRIEKTERLQGEFDAIIGVLNLYGPRKTEKLLINAKKFYDGREIIINAFKDKIFPMVPTGFGPDEDETPRMSPDEDEIPRMSPDEDELSKHDELYENISNADQKIDRKLIKKYFNKRSLLELFKFLRYSQNKATGGAKQALIEVNLSDLKKDIRNMSDDEIKNKNLDLIAYFVEKILDTVKK